MKALEAEAVAHEESGKVYDEQSKIKAKEAKTFKEISERLKAEGKVHLGKLQKEYLHKKGKASIADIAKATTDLKPGTQPSHDAKKDDKKEAKPAAKQPAKHAAAKHDAGAAKKPAAHTAAKPVKKAATPSSHHH